MVASIQPSSSARLFRQKLAILACAGLVLLGGCSKPVEKTEDIRPVRVMKLESGNIDTVAEFSGDVRARYESRLGFRVGGKIVGTAGEGINGFDRGAKPGRQQQRGDRKIFVMFYWHGYIDH